MYWLSFERNIKQSNHTHIRWKRWPGYYVSVIFVEGWNKLNPSSRAGFIMKCNDFPSLWGNKIVKWNLLIHDWSWTYGGITSHASTNPIHFNTESDSQIGKGLNPVIQCALFQSSNHSAMELVTSSKHASLKYGMLIADTLTNPIPKSVDKSALSSRKSERMHHEVMNNTYVEWNTI